MIGNYIKAVAVAVSRTTAKLMKTGQTTSYRTGDDGDFEAGRNVDFFTLAENNPFGNTNRFTDELGGQTYTNNIVIDWSTYDGSTVLGFRRTLSSGTWNSAIDTSLTVSIGTFTTGWRLPNVREVFNLSAITTTYTLAFNYPPFNITTNVILISSTTDRNSITAALGISTNIGNILSSSKTVANNYMPVRNFTVTGTTLS